ncbi:MAG: LysM peptidoglycan-binding domain-containing protein [Chloroflexi bacterium]|nr:LysM peptidoglycan-binding domain-containing protein [Chloroflexota bacterium]
MQALRQVGSGILFALVSTGLILGGISLALTEGLVAAPPLAVTGTSTPTSAPVIPTITPAPSDPVLPPSPTTIPSPTVTLPPPTTCPPPSGWIQYTIRAGDTLDALAQRYTITPESLLQANCLLTTALMPDTVIYVPPVPTPTSIPCGPPYGWITYTVRSGDNLFRIGLAYRVSVAELQQANCLGSSITIYAGQKIYVPNVPTSTPAITDTPTPTVTFTASPSATPAATATIPTATGTNTSTPTATATATASDTPSPTASASSTPTATPTFTPTP